MKRTSFSILCIMSCLSIFAQQENAITEVNVIDELTVITNYALIICAAITVIILIIASLSAFSKRKKSQI